MKDKHIAEKWATAIEGSDYEVIAIGYRGVRHDELVSLFESLLESLSLTTRNCSKLVNNSHAVYEPERGVR